MEYWYQFVSSVVYDSTEAPYKDTLASALEIKSGTEAWREGKGASLPLPARLPPMAPRARHLRATNERETRKLSPFVTLPRT